jgi:hypothetical protein
MATDACDDERLDRSVPCAQRDTPLAVTLVVRVQRGQFCGSRASSGDVAETT